MDITLTLTINQTMPNDGGVFHGTLIHEQSGIFSFNVMHFAERSLTIGGLNYAAAGLFIPHINRACPRFARGLFMPAGHPVGGRVRLFAVI